MSNHIETQTRKKIKGRVLFTGGGSLMIDDLMANSVGAYKMEKCPPLETSFRVAVRTSRPHVIVVCLSNETRDKLRMYTVLEENPDYQDLPIIAIGNQDDCDFFEKNMLQKNIRIFVRPLDKEGFTNALEQHLAEAIEKEQKEKEKEKKTAKVEKKPEEKLSDQILAAEKTLLEKIKEMNRNHGRKMILVVDDDVIMLNLIKLYLQDLYDITLVPSGKLALKFLSKKSADLVLLDYMMPDEDGPAVLQQIRENSPCPDIPVLFLTGVADKEKVMRGLEFRPNGYMLKPATRQALLEKTTEILLGL